MNITPSGIPLPFEVTFDSDSLFVAMKVYDVTGTPALVSTVPMVHVDGGTYLAMFTPAADKSYLVRKSVYTTDSYAVLDSDYGQGSESFRTVDGAPAVNLSQQNIDDISAGVWDALAADHGDVGTFGEIVSRPAEEFIGSIVGVVEDDGDIG